MISWYCNCCDRPNVWSFVTCFLIMSFKQCELSVRALPLRTVLVWPALVLRVCVSVCLWGGGPGMGIVRGLWGVVSKGSSQGQLGGDCKYSVCMCVRGKHSCGIVSRPAGRHQDKTNTHRFTTFSFTLPFPWPRSPSLLPFYLPIPLSPSLSSCPAPWVHGSFPFTCWSVW